ncbi:MAG: ribosome maturation factor RimM [bacterium]|nr:ribosome maturation factor RimM [bacterium]
MNLIYFGKIVNTHGLKGEIRIISDFKYKEDVLKRNNKIYIKNMEYIINSYRHHKIYDMVTLNNINTIDAALNLKGEEVYINRLDYKFEGYLNEELIGLEVYDKSNYKGKVVDILKSNLYDILVIDGIKRHMVPNIDKFIDKVDLENKKINIKYIRGLDNED